VLVSDVAHALSNLCRFNGHCREFYSVAQHSVLVARVLQSEGFGRGVQVQGLLHDAQEAYVGDVPTPVKGALGSSWDALEWIVRDAVRRRFQIPHDLDPAVEMVDARMLATESLYLQDPPLDLPAVPYHIAITPWSPTAARAAFLDEIARLEIR